MAVDTCADPEVVECNMMTMPGLPKIPAAEKIDVDSNGKIVGLF